jgi:hypothetical protein
VSKVTTFQELILGAEVALDQEIKRRDAALATVKMIHATAQREVRGLDEREDGEAKSAMEAHTRAVGAIREAEERVSQLKSAKNAEDANTKLLETRAEGGQHDTAARPAYDRVARVGREERTYHKGNDRTGAGFVRDVTRQFVYRDLQSEQRLLQHMQEERVERGAYLERAAGDTNTGNWAGLVVPQYLTDLYAPNIAALRPFANICNQHELPPNGMTVNISRVTTASSAGLQANEFDAASGTSIDDTILTENVQTAAGQQSLSRQAIDRGTGIEGVVMDDLFRRYATAVDNTLITQGTTGLSAVATSTAFTTASPDFMSTTAANSLFGKILSAQSGVEAALLAYGFPTHAIMHSRRWAWIQSRVNSVWPGITQPTIPVQAGGINVVADYNAGARGTLPNGLTVIIDNNIATNSGTATSEDEIYVVPSSECHLWEDPAAPVFIRAEQPKAANLAVLLVLYGYFAYSFRRYTGGMGKVNGTGLTTPTF